MNNLRRNRNRPLAFSHIHVSFARRERAVTVSLAGRPSVSGAHPPTRKEGDMRRITSLILVLVAMATAAAFPLTASANHGPPHGSRVVLSQ